MSEELKKELERLAEAVKQMTPLEKQRLLGIAEGVALMAEKRKEG